MPSLIAHSVRNILSELGENPDREGLHETPSRVEKSLRELCSGYTQNPRSLITLFESEGYDQVIAVRGIEFYSLCEHHMLPFFGTVDIQYVPHSKIISLSKLPRLVDIFARRLQNQERLTKQIADSLSELLSPRGVAVRIEATHLRMRMRGVKKQNCSVETSSFAGCLSAGTFPLTQRSRRMSTSLGPL